MFAILFTTLFGLSEFGLAQIIRENLSQSQPFGFINNDLKSISSSLLPPVQNYKFFNNKFRIIGDDGKYRPEIHNRYSGDNGKYQPDDRGKYTHKPVPYDGGYGDKGAAGGEYIHNDPGYKGSNIQDVNGGKYIYNDPGYKQFDDAYNNHFNGNKFTSHQSNNSNGNKNNDPITNGVYSKFPPSGFGDLKTDAILGNVKNTGSDSILKNNKNKKDEFNFINGINSQPSFNSVREISNNNRESITSSSNLNQNQDSRTKYNPSSNHVHYDGWKIIRFDKESSPPYHYLYETENKILAEETGRLHNTGNNNDENIKAFGFYEYYGDDGQKYHTDYTADEYGYIPKGIHIHKAIQKALEYQLQLAKNNKRS